MEGAVDFPGLSIYCKGYTHAENAETSGIGPLRNRLDHFLKFARFAKIFEKTRDSNLHPLAARGLKGLLGNFQRGMKAC